MVSKSKKESAGKKKKIKVLNLNKETVKNLTDDEAKHVMGGTTTCLIGGIQPRVSAVAQSWSGAGETLGCAGQRLSIIYSG
jgi:natural product precursor